MNEKNRTEDVPLPYRDNTGAAISSNRQLRRFLT